MYTCKTCDLRWEHKAEFDEHVVCHISDDPYVCMSCRKHFSSRELIEQHVKQEHPNGDSRCGLRGIKKGRQFVEELEKNGSLTLFGKIRIPKTPRNQNSRQARNQTGSTNNEVPSCVNNSPVSTSLLISEQTSAKPPVLDVPVTHKANKLTTPGEGCNTLNDNSVQSVWPVPPGPSQNVTQPPTLSTCRPLPVQGISDCVNSATVSSENNLTGSTRQITTAASLGLHVPATDVKSLATRSRPILQKLQSKLIPTILPGNSEKVGATMLNTGTLLPTNNASSQQDVTINSLFGVVNRETGVLEPALVPSKIQKLAPSQPSQKKTDENVFKNPQYHVKHITEYTNAKTITTISSTTAVSPQPVYLIPVNTVFHPLQTNQNVIQPVNVSSSVHVNQDRDTDVQTNTTVSPNTSATNTTVGISEIQSGSQVVQLEKNKGSHSHPRYPLILPKQQSQILLVNHGFTVSNVNIRTDGNTMTETRSTAETVLSDSTASQGSPPKATDTPVSVTESLPTTSESTDSRGLSGVTNINSVSQQLPKQCQPPQKEAVESLKEKGPSVPVEIAKSSFSTDNNYQGSRYLFRIKPGHGFVCEACKKYTKDEFIYRNHIWNHFHINQKACQSCSADDIYRHQVSHCKLVNSIVCNLVKKSALERQRVSTPKLCTDEVINISDDEDEQSRSKNLETESGTEVIVVDEEDTDNSGGLQIRIASTCTISEDDYDSGRCGSNDTLKEIPDKEETEGKTEKTEELAKETAETVSHMYESKEANSTISKSKKESEPEDSARNKKIASDAAIGYDQDGEHDNNTHELDCSKNEGANHSIHVQEKNEALPANIQKEVKDQVQAEKSLTKTEPPKSVQNSHETVKYSHKETADFDENAEIKLSSRDFSNAFYMCGYEFCSFTACTPHKYKMHLRQNHLNEYNFVCCHCGLKDYSEESHIRHLNTHASAKSFALYTCPARLCSYKSNLLQYYVFHLNAHLPEDVNLKCVYCHKIFESTEKLQLHLQNNLLKFVSCNFCAFKFGNRYHVIQHMRKAHPDKPRQVSVSSQIVCLEREINFYNPPPAKSCFNSHTEDGIISQSLNIPAILEQVQMESTSDKKKKTNNESKSNDQNNTGSEGNKRKTKSKINENQKINGKESSKCIGPKSLLCPKCSYLSYNVALYNRHLSLHDEGPDREKRFVCNFCPTAVDNYVTFKNHVSNHLGRNEIKLFNCTMCGFSTNLKCHIMDHCQDNHDGVGMFTVSSEVVISNETSCKYCDFKSRQAEQVILHEKLVHQLQPSVSLGQKVSEKEIAHSASTESLSQKVASKETPKKHKYHCDYCEMVFKHKLQLITHLKEHHDNIDDKKFTFYKCKYCPLGSTRKEMIITHLEREHPGQDIRILRKIEKVPNKHLTEEESLESVNHIAPEEVMIPDGNVFKSQFKCPKCPFTTLMRLNAMRHLKDHPELKPVRQISTPKNKKTARKSTTGPCQKSLSVKPKNSLVQNTELKENPFTAVKEAVDKLKSSSEKSAAATYSLGDEDLHVKLSECFIPIEKDIKFKCRICQQEIIKKFVLHRHILNHLNVSFFKCQYCTEGSVEKTLLFGHIQKSHPQQPLLYHQLEKTDVDNLIKERVFEQKFDSQVESKLNVTGFKCIDQTKDDEADLSVGKDHSASIYKHGHVIKNSEDVGNKKYKCTFEGCRYRSRRADLMENHLLSHGDTTKDYKCSVCDLRSGYLYVSRHVSKEHNRTATAIQIDFEEFKLNGVVKKKMMDGKRESSVESLTSVMSDKEGQYVKNVHGKKIKVESLTVSKNVIYELKKVFKCKDCGEKKTSKSGLYKHFKSTKCRRPALQCSLCSFQRFTKIDILRHARIRHPGKKVKVNSLPLTSKMASLKIPIRQNFADTKSEPTNKVKYEAAQKQSSATKNEKRSSCSASIGEEEENLQNSQDIVCGICSNYKCESVMKLQYHINTAHDGKLLHCQECAYKTPLIKHMFNHCTNVHLQRSPRYSTNIKEENDLDIKSESKDNILTTNKYRCVMCSYEHEKFHKMRPHYYKHLEYKPYVCTYCGAGLQGLHNVKRHILNIHKDKPVKYKYVKNVQTESKVEKLMMDSRKRRQRRKATVEKNQGPGKSKKRPLEYDSETECQKVKRTKGLKGEKLVPTRTVLDEQVMKNGDHSPFKFQVCLDETGKRVLKCSQCNYTCQNKKRLKQHMATHGARFFKCFYCNYSSKMK